QSATITRRDCFGRERAQRNHSGAGARPSRSPSEFDATLKTSSSRQTFQFRGENMVLSHLLGDANERRRNLPARLQRALEAARDFRDAPRAFAGANWEFKDPQTGARVPHLHFQIPPVGLLAHAEPL